MLPPQLGSFKYDPPNLTTFRSNRNWRPWRQRSRHLSGSAAKSGGNFCRQKEVLRSTPLGPWMPVTNEGLGWDSVTMKVWVGIPIPYSKMEWSCGPTGILGGGGSAKDDNGTPEWLFFFVCWSIATLPRFFFSKSSLRFWKMGLLPDRWYFFLLKWPEFQGTGELTFFWGYKNHYKDWSGGLFDFKQSGPILGSATDSSDSIFGGWHCMAVFETFSWGLCSRNDESDEAVNFGRYLLFRINKKGGLVKT